MKTKKIKCPCGCRSEIWIGKAEKGDFFEDVGNILLSTGKQGQKEHKFAVVINKDILKLLNKIAKSKTTDKKS